MRVPDSIKALPILLAACGDPKEHDTDWAEDSAPPPVQFATAPCDDLDATLSVPTGSTDVAAHCFEFTTTVEATLQKMFLSDLYANGMVDGRAGQMADDEGFSVFDPVETNFSGELRFEGGTYVLPANSTTSVWLYLDVGEDEGNYQAVLEGPDNIVTEPAGLQPGGTFPYVGTDITIQ